MIWLVPIFKKIVYILKTTQVHDSSTHPPNGGPSLHTLYPGQLLLAFRKRLEVQDPIFAREILFR